jgi:Domain of unknown function (DUF4440)
MLSNPTLVVANLLLSVFVPANNRTSHSCAGTDQELRIVAHRFWAGYNHRDPAALDQLLDDRLVYITGGGTVLSKAQLLAQLRVLTGSVRQTSAEEPQNVATAVTTGSAVISFTKEIRIIHQPTGAVFAATVRMTEMLVCSGQEWRVLAFQETLVSDPSRPTYAPAVAQYDDYVGEYRFGADGTGGRIAVTRQGDRLYEAWGADPPVEIFPARFDAFFTRDFPLLERFVRNRSGSIVGILYTLGDSEVEARRVR